MKYMKLVLVALLILAVAAMTFGCPAPADPGSGTTPTTSSSNTSTTGGGGGGQRPDEGGNPAVDTSPGKLQFVPINAQNCEISGYTGQFANGTVTIPATYTDPATNRTYNVTRIAAGAFKNCTSLTTIIVPDAITAIGAGAFEGCSKLTSITLPFVGSGTGTATGVELASYFGYIFGADTFAENASAVPETLKTVVLSDRCTKIADFAFDSCTSITEIRLSNTLESIGRYAFAGTSITNVVLPDSLTSIGMGAYARCRLESMTLPFVGADASAEIGYLGYLFGASSYRDNGNFVPATLATVTISDVCTELGAGAFYGCENLTNPKLPSTILRVGRDAFEGTAYLDAQANGLVYIGNVLYTYKGELTSPTITVKNGTVAIASGAFEGLDITAITIPETVKAIGFGAFKDTKLAAITLSFVGESADGTNTHFGFIFGDETLADNGASVPATLKTVILNASCKTIADRAFFGCATVEKIEIGSGVTSIAKNAFFSCPALKAITVNDTNASYKVAGGLLYNKAGTDLVAVPQAITGEITLLNITEIGEAQFANCIGITKINLPSTLRSIAKDAFRGATALASFGTFPANLSYVGSGAYAETAWFAAQANGVIKTGKVLYRVKGAMTNVTVPSGIVYITEGAFEDTGAKTIVLSSTVESVGFGIFRGCTALEKLSLPFVGQAADGTGNTLLGYMFGAETLAETEAVIPATLTEVALLDGCTALGANAFYGCANLSTITFPNSITVISGTALDGTAYLNAQEPGSVLYIGKILYRFFPLAEGAENDDAYDVIVRPGTIMIAEGAFAGTDVRSVIMPDSTVTIGDGAFANCKKLANLRISSVLSSLGVSAFSGCTSLTQIYIPGTLKVISQSAFEGCTALRKVCIRYGIEKIDVNAFNGCRAIAYTIFIVDEENGEENNWMSLDIQNQGTSSLVTRYTSGTPDGYPEEDVNPPDPAE